MKRFESACEKLKEQVAYSLTWPEVIQNLTSPAPKKRPHSTSYNKFITSTTPKAKKRKTGDHPLYSKTIPELKVLLKEKSLPASGNKPELVQRLINHVSVFPFFLLFFLLILTSKQEKKEQEEKEKEELKQQQQ
jgi:hypothetical protein